MDPRVTRAAARIRAAEAVARRQARAEILGEVIDGDEIDEVAALFPEWSSTATYTVDDFARHDGVLYRCVQGHAAQDAWTPAATPALWAPARQTQGASPDPWVQPTGSSDAYNTGDRVMFNGAVYESVINANVWSPTGYPAGWALVP